MDPKIFDTLLEPVFVIDANLKVLYCNEPAATLCDLSVRKIMRSGIFTELFDFAEAPAFLRVLATLTEPSAYQELAFKSKTSEKPGKAQLTCQPFETPSAPEATAAPSILEKDGEKPRVSGPSWVIYFRDVTLEETLQKKYRAELEQVQHYSKNLERMVDERTAEVKRLNQMMTALLDSLEQGFFIFNQEGLCLDVFSKACLRTVESAPAGKKIWDVLKLEPKQVPGFQKWLTTIFAEMLPFEDLSPLGPQKFPHSAGQEIKLEYYPLQAQAGGIEAIVVVASDITNLVEAQREAEFERAHAKMIIHLVKNRRQVLGFLREAEELVSQLLSETNKAATATLGNLATALDQDNVFRLLHTLKGGAATFSIKEMADLCHHAEDRLSKLKWEPGSPTLIQGLIEDSQKIASEFQRFQDENQDILGEKSNRSERWVEIASSKLAKFQVQLKRTNPNLARNFSEEFIFEPIQNHFLQYNETVLSVAEQEGKSLHPLVFKNADLKISPEPYETLFSTLIHAYRNSVDHGIETPDERTTNGKPAMGQITTSFRRTKKQNREWLLIEIRDDGRGIDPSRIRAKLAEKGQDTSHETDRQVIQHVFDSQFSTRDVVTSLSGRGVGMDAIQKASQDLGGKTWASSRAGRGNRLFVLVPWLENSSVTTHKKAS